jgi:hypothetical protein
MIRPCKALLAAGGQIALVCYGIAFLCIGTAAAIEYAWLCSERSKL